MNARNAELELGDPRIGEQPPGNAELQLGPPHSTGTETPPTAATKPQSTRPTSPPAPAFLIPNPLRPTAATKPQLTHHTTPRRQLRIEN